MLQYGKGAIMGHPATDRACFGNDNSHCLDNLSFLTVVNSADLSSLKGSGLIGLAPTPEKDSAEFKDPLQKGVPGFIAQLKNSEKFNKDFEDVFSFYLSNDPKVKGKMLFGGTDFEKFAKKGATENDVFWSKQSSNPAYWAVYAQDTRFGEKPIADKQQMILDNGMSFAMAPTQTFVKMVNTMFTDHGIACQEMQPIWGCECTKAQYDKLPNLSFNF